MSLIPTDLNRMVMRLLLSNGEHFKEKMLGFPLAQEFASSGLLVVCIERDDKIVAACGIRSLFNILVLHIKEGYRGRGIGAQLLKKAVRTAEKRRLAFITLTVSADNLIAFNLYRKFGFKEVLLLRKSRQVFMMLPLTFLGKLAYAFFHVTGLLLPNTVLSYVHSWLYRKTL